MKTLDHAFNSRRVEKERPKMESDAEIRADVRECVWLRANIIIKNGCAQKQYGRCRVCPKTQECREECWCTARSPILFRR